MDKDSKESIEKAPFPLSTEALAKQPTVKEGTMITCRACGGLHTLKPLIACGFKSNIMMCYVCKENIYLGAIHGKLIAGLKII